MVNGVARTLKNLRTSILLQVLKKGSAYVFAEIKIKPVLPHLFSKENGLRNNSIFFCIIVYRRNNFRDNVIEVFFFAQYILSDLKMK